MRLSWASQAPVGVSFSPEEDVLTMLEALAVRAGFQIAKESQLEHELRARADMVVDTPMGRLLFEVRRKARDGRARIDIETRPSDSYRTRHVLLEQTESQDWVLVNDSDLPEGDIPVSPEAFQSLIGKLFARR
jgi:hypothetical protein